MSEEEGLVFKKARGVRRARSGRVGGGALDEEDDVGAVVVARKREREERAEAEGQEGVDVQYGRSAGAAEALAEVLAGEAAERLDEGRGSGGNTNGGNTGGAAVAGAYTEDGERIYTGEKGYAEYFKTREKLVKGTGLRAGPVKASSYAKVTSVIDYQPNVCKDYKQTGYCGYGHNCKYLHDRGDYKSGWEIDQEWNRTQGKEENYEVESSDEDDSLPFACFICKGEFKNPVVTKCMHYFCESCALTQERKKKVCFICQKPTAGIFNIPTALIAKLDAKKAALGAAQNGKDDAPANPSE